MTQTNGSRQMMPTLTAACLATLMLLLDITVINTALSKIAHSLSTGLSGLQWILDGYTLPLAALVLTAGVLADRLGRKRLFLCGLVLFTGASVLCGLAGSIEMLDAARAVQGAGAAILFAVALALIAHVTPTVAERTKAMSIYGATIGIGLAIGPLVGGALTEWIGWRAIFLVNVPVGALAIWLTATRVGESRDPDARRIDWPGQMTLIAGLFGVTLGLLRGNEHGWTSTLVLASLSAGAALLVVFIAIQARTREPMLPLRLFRLPEFTGVQLSVFALAASSFAIYLYLSLYLQGPLHRSPIETGLAYLPGSFLMFFASMATPKLVPRLGNGIVAAIGLALATGGLMLLLLTQTGSSWTITLPSTALIMTGIGLYNPTMSMLAMNVLPDGQSGLASGAFDTFRQTGMAIGTAALGAFIHSSALTRLPAHSYVTSLHQMSVAAAGVSAVGVLGTVALLGRRRAAAQVPEAVGADAIEPA